MKRLLLMIAVVISSAPAQAQQTDAGTNARATAITGQVFSEEGQPLRGAAVSVFKMPGGFSTGTVTDAEGKFRVGNLMPGNYRVSVSLAPYVNAANDNPRGVFVGDDVTLKLVKGGVITGTVFDEQNEPLVGAMVSAQFVRYSDGEPARGGSFGGAMTDDRGVYRLFGLPAGAYLVVVRNAAGMMPNMPTDAPTYFPSASRAAAQEITVGVGMEVSGIDVRFRGEKGHVVSGIVTGLVDPGLDATLSITLSTAGGGIASNFLSPRTMGNRFVFHGVPDGDYDLYAIRSGNNANEPRAFSQSLPVRVRGGDVSGLELKLIPPAAITGNVVVEKLPLDNRSCAISRVVSVEEVVVRATPYDPVQQRTPSFAMSAPNVHGDFFLRNLTAGRFRVAAELPGDLWYVKSLLLKSSRVNSPAARAQNAATRPIDVGQHGVTLTAGEWLTGLTFTVAEGAASVQGRVVAEAGKSLPSRLQVHLVPVETAASEVRFVAAQVRSDATFTLQNIAPGRYWIVARRMTASGFAPENPAELRRTAVAANQAITLTTCQRVKEFSLKFDTAVK